MTVDEVREYIKQNRRSSIGDLYRNSGLLELASWEDRKLIAQESFGMDECAYHEGAHAVFHTFTGSQLAFVTVDPLMVVRHGSHPDMKAVCIGLGQNEPFCEVLIAAAGLHGSLLYKKETGANTVPWLGRAGDEYVAHSKMAEIVHIKYPTLVKGTETWQQKYDEVDDAAADVLQYILADENSAIVQGAMSAVGHKLIEIGSLSGDELGEVVAEFVTKSKAKEAFNQFIINVGQRVKPWLVLTTVDEAPNSDVWLANASENAT